MISVDEARRLVAEAIPAPVSEEISYRESVGRVLAAPLVAPFSLPRFTNSAMDGYAVRAADTAGASTESPVRLEVVGVSAAAAPADVVLSPGSCTQVMTGGVLPEGADAVVIVEHTDGFHDKTVAIHRQVAPGANVRRAGEEVAAGEELIAAGTQIGPPEIGVIVSFGCERVAVYRRPRLALLATGDELREPGEELGPGEIYNSNLHVLAAAAQMVGAEICTRRIVRDDGDAMVDALREACERSDVIVTSGGVSRGRFDHVRSSLGVSLQERFWRVAQKPGKPLLFARGQNGDARPLLMFGLPGNPVSSLICLIEYVVPALLRWQGASAVPKLHAQLAEPFPRDAERHRFLFGKARREANAVVVTPARKLGSHMLTSALDHNCLIEAPAGSSDLARGQRVLVQMLPWSELVWPGGLR